MNVVCIATWADVPDGVPTAASVEGVDLVIIRRGDEHSVLHGRCLHRGALLADGEIRGGPLSAVCTVGLAGATIGAKGMMFRALQRLYATPIDGEHLELRGVVNVEITDDEHGSEALVEQLAPAVSSRTGTETSPSGITSATNHAVSSTAASP